MLSAPAPLGTTRAAPPFGEAARHRSAAHMQEAFQEPITSEAGRALAAGTTHRRHPVEALAGLLTELISANQREDETAANGNALSVVQEDLGEPEDEEDEEDRLGEDGADEDEPRELSAAEDPGAIRR